MSRIKKINIVFHNGDMIALDFVPLKNKVFISGIEKILSCADGDELQEQLIANNIVLEILDSQRDQKTALGCDFDEHIDARDITMVTLVLNDDTELTYYTYWDAESDLYNAAQEWKYVGADGHVRISIVKEDFYDLVRRLAKG